MNSDTSLTPIYPYFLNPFFSHYGFKICPLALAIPIIQKIIEDTAFQNNPKKYFKNWKKNNPTRISDNGVNLAAATIRRIFQPLIEKQEKPDQQLVDKLQKKLELYRESDKVLKNIKLQISKIKPPAIDQSCLSPYIEELKTKDNLSAAESKILKKMEQMLLGTYTFKSSFSI